MPRKTDKRMRLIQAAKTLIHQQGFNLTTLADIAGEANVPLGNVYYYFKTKEAIGLAVIERNIAEWTERMQSWTQEKSPLQRLQSFIDCSLDDLETTARYGCSIGGLCQELGKQGGPLADLAAKLLHDLQSWVTEQFKAMGHHNSVACELGAHLMSNIQGMFLLTHTFKDPKIAERQSKVLHQWLVALSRKKINSLEEAFS